MKTDKDIEREDIAFKMNDQLMEYEIFSIHVVAEGKRGPYSIVLNRLSKAKTKKLLKHILRFEDL